MRTNQNHETLTDPTRQRILQAAMQLFGQVGYAQTTTRRIAETAGVNEVTLFRHFGNKKSLLMACIEAHNAAGFTGTFEAELTGSYPEDIQRMVRLQVEDTRANLEVLRLLMCDARSMPELQQALLTGSRGNLSLLAGYFQRQIDAGTVRPGLPAEALAMAFDSLFSYSLINEYLFQGSLTPHLATEQTLSPLVDLFIRGTQAEE
ncbi:MAG: TetR/AcrR family transcriptional regulator [Chloroflexi bacterium]|nr:TetR/AcrR family transcriptional regulator [Chloroflexota bacterium]